VRDRQQAFPYWQIIIPDFDAEKLGSLLLATTSNHVKEKV
jgi:hypothetical protein